MTKSLATVFVLSFGAPLLGAGLYVLLVIAR